MTKRLSTNKEMIGDEVGGGVMVGEDRVKWWIVYCGVEGGPEVPVCIVQPIADQTWKLLLVPWAMVGSMGKTREQVNRRKKMIKITMVAKRGITR